VKVVRHDGPRPFLDRAGQWLEEKETERALILGIAADLMAGTREGPAWLATVERQGAVVTAALRTPPHHLVVSRAPEPALEAIAADLHEGGESLPGVEGPSAAAETFAGLWRSRTGAAVRPGMSQRIYECGEVVHGVSVRGGIRLAAGDDVAVLVEWSRGFYRDTGLGGAADDEATIRGMIASGRLFVWHEGEPRSMVAWSGPTPHGVRISFVYTPPEHRGMGYATSTVAGLTERMLRSGRRFCCLYTDIANPTSNRLYQRIGYRAVCEWGQLLFG
jgi:predicted GNAT family acetyltransferase